MTFRDILEYILPFFPNATFDERDGQLIIYTNMTNTGSDPEVYVDMGDF